MFKKYDDEPVCAQSVPYSVEVQAGESYWWCACGYSDSQPFCDGSHIGKCFEPVEYRSSRNRVVFFCGCKKTKKPPFCDGTHLTLKQL